MVVHEIIPAGPCGAVEFLGDAPSGELYRMTGGRYFLRRQLTGDVRILTEDEARWWAFEHLDVSTCKKAFGDGVTLRLDVPLQDMWTLKADSLAAGCSYEDALHAAVTVYDALLGAVLAGRG